MDHLLPIRPSSLLALLLLQLPLFSLTTTLEGPSKKTTKKPSERQRRPFGDVQSEESTHTAEDGTKPPVSTRKEARKKGRRRREASVGVVGSREDLRFVPWVGSVMVEEQDERGRGERASEEDSRSHADLSRTSPTKPPLSPTHLSWKPPDSAARSSSKIERRMNRDAKTCFDLQQRQKRKRDKTEPISLLGRFHSRSLNDPHERTSMKIANTENRVRQREKAHDGSRSSFFFSSERRVAFCLPLFIFAYFPILYISTRVYCTATRPDTTNPKPRTGRVERDSKAKDATKHFGTTK